MTLSVALAELEWQLSKVGGIKSDLESDPRGGGKLQDFMMASLGAGDRRDRESDEDDW